MKVVLLYPYTFLLSLMRANTKNMRIIGGIFTAVVLVSGGLIVVNYSNYLGLLESMNEVEFSIDEMTHIENGNTVDVSISFSIINPSSYSRLKFSSLQCQLYLVIDENEEYLGTTGYAPPVDVPLRENEVRSYTTIISINKNNILSLTDGVIEPELDWRVRNILHFSTPIRRYYQNINLYYTSENQS